MIHITRIVIRPLGFFVLSQALQLVADDMEMTLEELMKIPPGPRREFHDDMTVLFIDLRGRDSRNAEKS